MGQFRSASGYGGFEASPLARVGYYDRILQRTWEKDFIPQITNGQIDERITMPNQVVQFTREPRIPKWRDYDKNQELVPSGLVTEGLTMVICNAKYQDIKIDKLDQKQMAERWDTWEESFLNSCYQSLTELWRDWVLAAMVLEAAADNKGNGAGIHGTIKLGAAGAPETLTEANVVRYLARLKRVLTDKHQWVDGQMFAVVPTAMFEVLTESQIANASAMGDCVQCSLNIDGFMPKRLCGFNIIETTYVPTVMDSTNQLCYNIIAGHADAFVFAADIVEGRLVEPTSSFEWRYQMLAVWGGKAITPDALVVGYVTFGEQ